MLFTRMVINGHMINEIRIVNEFGGSKEVHNQYHYEIKQAAKKKNDLLKGEVQHIPIKGALELLRLVIEDAQKKGVK